MPTSEERGVAFRKNRPVLFEVMKKERAERLAAHATKAADGGRASAPAPVAAAPEPTPLAATSLTTHAHENGTESTSAHADHEHAGVMRFSIPYPLAGLIGVAAVVLLLISFHLGRRIENGRGSPENDATMLALLAGETDGQGHTSLAGDRSEPQNGKQVAIEAPPDASPASLPRRDHFENTAVSLPVAPVEPQPAPAAKPTNSDAPAQVPLRAAGQRAKVTLEKGVHYVVIQHFRKKDASSAEQAGAFLRANGIECALQHNKDDIRLIAAQPLRLSEKDAAARKAEEEKADNLLKQIKQLGKDYSRSAGYAFDQCEVKKF